LENHIKKIFAPVAWILLLCFGISLAALIIYIMDNNLNDTTLFLLLTVMRYSSFIMCICAFYKLSVNIYRCVRERKFRLFSLLIYIVLIGYGVIVILMDAFIIAFSGGHG
jgi:hypothetical protein